MSVSVIWEDTMDFEGYLEHEIVQDLDDSGCLIVISRWSSGEAARLPVDLFLARRGAKTQASSTHDLRFTTYDPTNVASHPRGLGMTV